MSAIFTKWFPPGFRLINAGQLTSWFNNPQMSYEDTITAFAGGGQAGAYQLSADISRISVCATNGDSVKLPQLSKRTGGKLVIINDGAANLQIYSFAAANIDGIDGAATGVTLTAGRRAFFFPVTTAWYSGYMLKSA